MYDKLLKRRQSFRMTLYYLPLKMAMTNFNEIFLCEANNGRKLEVNSSHVSQRTTLIAAAAGAALYIILYTNSVQPCIPLDVT